MKKNVKVASVLLSEEVFMNNQAEYREYVFVISGTLTVIAESEEVARDIIDFEIGGLDLDYNLELQDPPEEGDEEPEAEEELYLDE
jgi:hypothetical protein